MKPKPPEFRIAAYVVSCVNPCAYSARIEPVDDQFTLPSACPKCQGPLREEPDIEILNLKDYPDGLDGLHVRVQAEGQSARRGRYERRVVKETYAETGEPFEYDRRFFRDLNLYQKIYTSLTTGDVAVDSTEPLSDHQGYGAAKRSRDANDG